MYDRKKITLFILLIATVILGGLAVFLAIQVNQSQAPDDSLAGVATCSARYPEMGSYYAEQCGARSTASAFACENLSVTLRNCEWRSEIGECVANSGLPAYLQNQSACIATSLTECHAGSTVLDQVCKYAAATGCTVAVGSFPATISEGESKCINNQMYKCTNGSASITGTCGTVTPPDPGQTGTDNCTQSGQTITHGATSCIDGTNYSCSNGTVTPGGSCGTTTPDPVTPDPGTTGSSCTSTAPIKAKLTSPGNGAVVNTNTATLAWDRNGSFGEGCESQNNEFRVRVTTVGLTEACPTNTSNSGSYTKVGTVDAAPAGTFNLSVETGKKYCWLIRKHNGAEATDSGIRSFTVDIAAVAPTTGVDEEETGGTTTGDIDPTTGEVLSASGSGSLPATAIISDELDPLILGMILVIIGLTLYKFDFGRKREEV